MRELIGQCEQEGRDLSLLMSAMGHDLQVAISVDCEMAGSALQLPSAMATQK